MAEEKTTERIYTAEVVHSGNRLLDLYRVEYAKRFGDAPFVPSEDHYHLKWAITSFGYEKASKLISSYLAMRDEWFEKQAYNLQTFRSKINLVINHLARTASPTQGLRLMSAEDVSSWYKAHLPPPPKLRHSKPTEETLAVFQIEESAIEEVSLQFEEDKADRESLF